MKETDISNNRQQNSNIINSLNPLNEPDAMLFFQKAYDKFESLILPHIDFIQYCPLLPPKELESVCKMRLYVQKYHSVFHNLCELGLPDNYSISDPVSINIDNFIHAVIDITATLFPCKDLYITADVSDDCKTATVDIRRTELILYNLISNAIIHNPKREKHIKISAFLRGDDLIIAVKDNGKGLKSPEDLKRFNDDNDSLIENVRYDYTTASITNVGIALIKKLVRQMNGKVKYYSTQRGVTAEISVPQSHFVQPTRVRSVDAMQSYGLAQAQLAGAMIEILDNYPDIEIPND